MVRVLTFVNFSLTSWLLGMCHVLTVFSFTDSVSVLHFNIEPTVLNHDLRPNTPTDPSPSSSDTLRIMTKFISTAILFLSFTGPFRPYGVMTMNLIPIGETGDQNPVE